MLNDTDKDKLVKWFSLTFPNFDFYWTINGKELGYCPKNDKSQRNLVWLKFLNKPFDIFHDSLYVNDFDNLNSLFKTYGGLPFRNYALKGINFPKDYLEMEMDIASHGCS
jgi:hypothetical protein